MHRVWRLRVTLCVFSDQTSLQPLGLQCLGLEWIGLDWCRYQSAESIDLSELRAVLEKQGGYQTARGRWLTQWANLVLILREQMIDALDNSTPLRWRAVQRPIEDNVKKLCPAVSNVMMVGDKRKFNVAIVTLKAKGATGELPGGDDLDGDALGLVDGVTTISQACKSPEFIGDAFPRADSTSACLAVGRAVAVRLCAAILANALVLLDTCALSCPRCS